MTVGLADQIASPAAVPIEADPARLYPVQHRPSISRLGACFKRTEDVVLGILLLLAFSWLLIGIALAIKVTSRGPIFFLQERRGRQGTTFRCLKFRSMYHFHTDFQCLEQTRQNDPRVTKVGRIIRRYSLDELPQLLNVIRGDMALVGPRPHALGTNLNGRLLHEISANYLMRYQMRPGITGWAQVNGWRGIMDSEDKLNQRLAHDLWYISNWSPWLDIKILLRTFACFFDRDRAF